MHAAVRRYRVIDAENLVKKIEEEFVERVKSLDGFVGYYVIDGGDGTVTSITIGETEQAVEASTREAETWIIERASYLVEGAPELTAGPVRVSVLR